MPRFCGGLAGYFGHDAVRYIEPRLAGSTPPGGLPTPDVMLLQCEELAVIDNLSGKLYLIVYADPGPVRGLLQGEEAPHRAEGQAGLFGRRAARRAGAGASGRARVRQGVDFLASVDKAKAYIAAGDSMQIVFGQRLKKRYTESPLSLYRALRSLNPSPYMYFYDMGDFQIVGASPEILVRQEQTPDGRKVTIRPLAGTRPRGGTPEQDQALEVELQGRSEGTCRAPDVDRPGPQRHRPHRADRQREGDGRLRGRTLLARDAHRQQCRGHH